MGPLPQPLLQRCAVAQHSRGVGSTGPLLKLALLTVEISFGHTKTTGGVELEGWGLGPDLEAGKECMRVPGSKSANR